MSAYPKYHGRAIMRESCRRLVKGLLDGDLMLEAGADDLAFRWVKPTTGPVLRRNGYTYAAIIQKADWPADVHLIQPGNLG